jgi:CCR4-NOT transcriptional complex subunit CAF120
MGHWYVLSKVLLISGFHDVFGLYGRPDRYIWDERNPKSLFFAYPKGHNRNDLFLTVDEAIKADHRAPNLPSVRMQFVNIHRRKLEQPPQPQYPNEKSPPVPAKGTPPRSDQDYRLPSMTFEKGNETPNYSDQSQPRSLSPITERTDIASRNNSQKTAKSIAFPERQGQSKQGSGSSKLSPTREQAHLESISDADSPTSYGQIQGSGPIPMAMPIANHVEQNPGDIHRRDTAGTMHTQETNWSQSSGTTPIGARNAGMTALTSATNDLSMQDQQSSAVTSPGEANANIHSPIPRKASTSELAPNKMDLHDEPAARYLMNMVDEPAQTAPPAQPVPPKNAEPERIRPTINTDVSKSPPPLGRKPSGARAIPPKKSANPRLGSVDDSAQQGHGRSSTYEYEDAHAYLAYADQPSPTAATSGAMGLPGAEPAGIASGVAGAAAAGVASAGAAALPKEEYAKITEHVEPVSNAQPEQGDQSASQQPRASAEEQTGQAQQNRSPPSADKPDLVSASQTVSSPVQQTATSPVQPKSTSTSSHNQQMSAAPSSAEDNSSAARYTMRVLPPLPQAPTQQQQQQSYTPSGFQEQPQRQASPARQQPVRDSQPSRRDSEIMPSGQQQSRQSEAPQPAYMDRPSSRSPGGNQMPRSSQYEPPQAPFMDQPRSRSPGMPQQPQHRSSSYSLRQAAMEQQQNASPVRPAPATNPSRQTMWNANFASGHGMPEPNKSGKFVELEEPQAQLTKAFAPHGLLQAGLQDKEERSAKKQEELAREMGSSLVNVPSKPPPPSAGLLGAVAQHEKERKGAGGIGATLTDREREKRLAVSLGIPV